EALDPLLTGDANADQVIDVGDAVYIVNYVFKGGPPPLRPAAADVNCDNRVNVGDAVYIVHYVFDSGPAPCNGL
ncbi:MAG: hypothetical protein GYA46_08740, partial [candidate division Zixibacteria bacterium]|nr:hypothetical protein [candidate division Zixibacteria bacterium]